MILITNEFWLIGVLFSFDSKRTLINETKYNKFMKYLIDHCLKKGDYPTDEELAADNKLFTHLQRTRVYSGYKETVAPFYDMLHLHFNKEEAYLCPFCDRYILRTRKHVYNCGSFKAQYDEDRDINTDYC